MNTILANIQFKLKQRLEEKDAQLCLTWEEIKNEYVFGEMFSMFDVKHGESTCGSDILYSVVEHKKASEDMLGFYVVEKKRSLHRISGDVIEAVLAPEFRPSDFNFFDRFVLPKDLHDENKIKNINILNDIPIYYEDKELFTTKMIKSSNGFKKGYLLDEASNKYVEV
jgi:hypothetical protein